MPSETYSSRLWANTGNKEAVMNPRACKGHVYLTPGQPNQSAVSLLPMVDLGMLCRVSGASLWQAAHLYTVVWAEKASGWQTALLLAPAVHTQWPEDSLFNMIWWEAPSWQAAIDIKIFFYMFVVATWSESIEATSGFDEGLIYSHTRFCIIPSNSSLFSLVIQFLTGDRC